MQAELEALARHEIGFNEFVRYTNSDWNRLSMMIYQRWRRKIPLGVGLEDVKQEMLFGAWKAVDEFNPRRSSSLQRFVIFRACAITTRYLHKQRAAKRRSQNAPSRHPILFSAIDSATEEWLEALVVDDGDPIEVIDARHQFDRMVDNASGVALFALVALKQAGGDLRVAGELLYDETMIRLAERWGNALAATNCIERTLCEGVSDDIR